MKKYSILIILLISLLFTGCSNIDSLFKHDVTFKAIDSEDNVIETVIIKVEGIDDQSNSGILNTKLESGTYTVSAVDNTESFLETSQEVVVNDDAVFNIHMFANSKAVLIKGIKSDTGELLDRSVVTINDYEGNKTEEGYSFILEIGKEYTATVTDPQGIYNEESYNFLLDNTVDEIEVSLTKAPTGTVEGKIYLTTPYTSDQYLLGYSYLEYFDTKLEIDEEGFSIELPEGEQELNVSTMFGGTAEKTITVTAGQTKRIDINVPLPEDYPVEKWQEIKGDFSGILGRWNKNNIKYSISTLDTVDNFYGPTTIKNMKDGIRRGIDVMDTALHNEINYIEVDNSEDADVEILICRDGDDYVHETKGLLHDQKFSDNKEVLHSVIYLNSYHMYMNYEFAEILTAHELGHSLSCGHSSAHWDLMNPNPYVSFGTWLNDNQSDVVVFTLLYSLAHPAENPLSKEITN